jgi:hypothetical protein
VELERGVGGWLSTRFEAYGLSLIWPAQVQTLVHRRVRNRIRLLVRLDIWSK